MSTCATYCFYYEYNKNRTTIFKNRKISMFLKEKEEWGIPLLFLCSSGLPCGKGCDLVAEGENSILIHPTDDIVSDRGVVHDVATVHNSTLPESFTASVGVAVRDDTHGVKKIRCLKFRHLIFSRFRNLTPQEQDLLHCKSK